MKINYRSEIDGLRCLSVISVLIYHANIYLLDFKILSGGFLGVDIFFVISGFLITNIFLKEYYTKGSINIISFFKRRVRRILPVLFLVLSLTLIGSWVILLPHSLVELCKSIISTLLFSSNFYFHFYGQSYGAENSLLVPLLHTWSLSIEEQFYILYPFIAVFFLKKKKFFNFLIFSFFFFFFSSLILRSYSSDANFYFIISRGWELIAGAISSVLIFNNYDIVNKINKLRYLKFFSLLIIITCLLLFSDDMNLPGILTLLPVTASCFMLLNTRKDFVYKMLSFPFVVQIGLISYSLYLWHYPIYAFNRILKLSSDNIIFEIYVIILLFFISFLSYIFFEKPFRNKKKISFKTLSISLIIIFISLMFFSLKIIKNNGYNKRIPKILDNHYKKNNYRNFSQNELACHNRIGNQGFCKYSVDNSKGEIFLLGDSQTDAMLSSFIELSKKENLSITHMSYSGNLFLNDFVLMKKKTGKVYYDEKRHDYRYLAIKNSKAKNKIVIINGIYEKYFNDMDTYYNNGEKKLKVRSDSIVHKDEKNFEKNHRILKLQEGFERSLKMILDIPNTRVVLVYPTPIPYRNLSQDLLNKFNKKRLSSLLNLTRSNFDNLENDFINNFQISRKYFKEINKKVFDLFDDLQYSNLIKVYPENILCESKLFCKIAINNKLIYFDKIHLSYEGSKLLNQSIIKELKK